MVLRSSAKEYALRTIHERHQGVSREIEGDEPFALIHDATPPCRATHALPADGSEGRTMIADLTARHVDDGAHEVDARRRVGNYTMQSDCFTHAVLGRNYDKFVVLGGVDLAGGAIDVEATRNKALERLGSSGDPGELTAAALDVMACEAATRLKDPELSQSQRAVANEWIDTRRKFELNDFLGNGVNRSRHRKQAGCTEDSVCDNRSASEQMLSLNWRRSAPVLAWSRAGASEWTDAFLAACGNVMVAPCTVPTEHHTVLRNSRDDEGFWNSDVIIPPTINTTNAVQGMRAGDLPRVDPRATELVDTMLRKTIHESASAALRVPFVRPSGNGPDFSPRNLLGTVFGIIEQLIPNEVKKTVEKVI